MKVCPNCGYQVSLDKTICPNCGAAIAANGTWPPLPMHVGMRPVPNDVKLITGKPWADLVLGFVAVWPLLFTGIGLIAVPILYYSVRKSCPVFARGFGFGALTIVAVLLGALAVCVVAFSQEHR